MKGRINIYGMLSDNVMPRHWPKSSVYRLQSVRARVIKECIGVEVELSDLLPFIKRITRDKLKDSKGKPIKVESLNTYRSVLIRYIVERIMNKELRPWEAKKIITTKLFKYEQY